MAFKLKQSPSYKWPVSLVIPVDGGKRETHVFDACFKRLPQSRIDEIRQLAIAIERGRADEDEANERQMVSEIMVGWDGVVDDDGEAVAFSVSGLTEMLEIPTVANQILREFFNSLQSEKKPGKRGN
jgi:hypothetical protein